MLINFIKKQPNKFGKNQAGLSIIELIISIAIFAIIAASAVSAILGSFSSNRLAGEEAKASFLNVEGLEATESIRNQAWENLINGDHGLNSSGGTWVFSGTSDTDPSGKYTRVINVGDVQRDGSGNIVNSGGTIDPDTKKITSTVSWDFTPTRNNQIQKITYLTNWQKSMGEGTLDGASGGCNAYCQGLAYIGGACRPSYQHCTAQGETHEPGGDSTCIAGPQFDTCCCF